MRTIPVGVLRCVVSQCSWTPPQGTCMFPSLARYWACESHEVTVPSGDSRDIDNSPALLPAISKSWNCSRNTSHYHFNLTTLPRILVVKSQRKFSGFFQLFLCNIKIKILLYEWFNEIGLWDKTACLKAFSKNILNLLINNVLFNSIDALI